MLGFHIYGIRCLKVDFVEFLLIPRCVNGMHEIDQFAFATKIVKIHLRLKWTILYGDH